MHIKGHQFKFSHDLFMMTMVFFMWIIFNVHACPMDVWFPWNITVIIRHKNPWQCTMRMRRYRRCYVVEDKNRRLVLDKQEYR